MSRPQRQASKTILHQLFESHGAIRKIECGFSPAAVDRTASLFMVKSGCFSSSIGHGQSGRSICLTHLLPDDVFGECGVFADSASFLSTTEHKARVDSEVYALPYATIQKHARSNPQIYSDLSVHINMRLNHTTERLIQLAFDDLNTRCLKVLINLTSLPDAMTCAAGTQLRVSRIELSDMLGCTRESAGRALKNLESTRAILVEGRTIVVNGYRYGKEMK